MQPQESRCRTSLRQLHTYCVHPLCPCNTPPTPPLLPTPVCTPPTRALRAVHLLQESVGALFSVVAPAIEGAPDSLDPFQVCVLRAAGLNPGSVPLKP